MSAGLIFFLALLIIALALSSCAGYSHGTDLMFGYWSAPR